MNCSPKLHRSAENIIQMLSNASCGLVFRYFVWGPLLLSCGFARALKNHKCWVPPNTTIRVAPNKYTISALRSAPENLRITMTYTKRMKRLSSFLLLKKELLKPAVAFWSKALRAKNPPSEPIFFRRACVNDSEFVHSDGQTYCTAGCETQTLCYTERIPEQYLVGFHSYLYAFLRDENGEPRTKRDPITQAPDLGADSGGAYIPDKKTLDTVDRIWKSAKGTFNRKIKVLKTPMLLETAREHFNCPTLDGVDLENQGGEGTVAAHFEKRLVMNELMSGSLTGLSVVSKLTLAFFYDSGWYDVDMSQAEPLTWGRNLGCDFVLKSCYEHMEIQKLRNATISPWCNEVTSSTQCLPDENAFGSCELNNFNFSLDPQNQYFYKLDNVSDVQLSHYGGTDELADYCPMGTYICTGSKRLVLIFGGTRYKCPPHGGSIRIDLVNSHYNLTGNAICPPCSDVCKNCLHEQQVHEVTNSVKTTTTPERSGQMRTCILYDVYIFPIILMLWYF